MRGAEGLDAGACDDEGASVVGVVLYDSVVVTEDLGYDVDATGFRGCADTYNAIGPSFRRYSDSGSSSAGVSDVAVSGEKSDEFPVAACAKCSPASGERADDCVDSPGEAAGATEE